jgi:lipoprotein-anchoring transpeptidase ErfK/SrfK
VGTGAVGYSDVLEQFGTGDGQIALHGTADLGDLGQEVSNGCVRMTTRSFAPSPPACRSVRR